MSSKNLGDRKEKDLIIDLDASQKFLERPDPESLESLE
jgi:hypothetical protein